MMQLRMDHQGQQSPTQGEQMIVVRAPGRPRLVSTGTVGRRKKVYNTRTISLPSRNEADEAEKDGVIDGEDNDVFYDAPEEVNIVEELTNMSDIRLEEVMQSKESAEWMEAIAVEVRVLIKNDTWKLAKRPVGGSVVSCNLVLKNKMNPDGSLNSRKARIVARRFTQRRGIDFIETFAPVARLDSVRLLMAWAVREKLIVHQLDVVATYLNGDLKEEIYMETPDYLRETLGKLSKGANESHEIRVKATEMLEELERGNRVCFLQKALYGLRQAGRQWHAKLDEALRGIGLTPATNDTCLYFEKTESEFTSRCIC